MATDDFLSKLIEGVGDAVAPLVSSLNSKEEFASFLSNFGWAWDQQGDINSIQSVFNNVETALTSLRNAVNANDTGSLATATVNLTRAIADLSSTNFSALPSPLNQATFWNTFPDDVLEFLIYQYFNTHQPFLFGTLAFGGVLKKETKGADAVTGRHAYDRIGVDWGRIPQSIAAPQDIFKDVYGWGQLFKHKEFMLNLGAMLTGFHALAKASPANERLLDLYYDADNPSRLETQMLVATLFQLGTPTDDLEKIIKAVLVAMPVPPKGDRQGIPEGIMFFPHLIGDAGLTIPLQPGIDLELSGGFDTEIMRALVRPSGIDIELPPLNAVTLKAHAEVRINLTTPRIIIGGAKSSRLEFSKAHIALGLSGPVTDFEYDIEAAIDSMNLILDFSQSDNFLKAIFGSDPQTAPLNYGIAWSNKSGLRFLGQPGLEIAMPVHLSLLNVINIDTIYLSARADLAKKSTQTVIALTAGFKLGPMSARVDKIGMKMDLVAADKEHPGNLGTLNLDLGFKPPNGVGLSIDTGVVKGGGFLRFNYEKGEYFGALELSIQNTINLKAIGIINTKMPDGSPGYALLILITAEFTPIQLGMGFSLIGVGGLLGLNHSTNIDALKSGVRTGAVSSILFPEDVVANITRIISDMTTIFPIMESHFIVAPMGKLGWFTPPLITLEMGIILDIPSPTLVIIGVLRCVLPEEKAPILKLQVNFAGGIDFNKGIIWFDASLFDSSILVYTLTGDMALRIGWGDNPLFILSVGGFHPAFHEVPPDLTNMTRLTISLLSGNNPRLVAQSYFAVTSNTVQSGANVELYAEACGFNVYGFLGYDLLVRFQPFYFIADIYAGLALRSGSSEIAGINVHCELSGPTPWHALGEASLNILFFSVSVGFDQSWGESAPPQILEPEDVLKLLVDAVTDSRNWKTDIPANTNLSVSAKQIELLPGEIILHPFGALTVSQKVVPLKLTINKFGNKKPAADTLFDISYSDGNTAYEEEQFAPAQFLQLNDAEKLSRKSFENMKSGLRFQGSDATVTSNENIDLDVTYDLIYVHKKKFLTIKAGVIRFFDTVFQIVSQGNAAAKSSYAVSKKKASNAPAKVEVAREGYKVVKVSDMAECEGSVAVATEVEAYEMYDTLIAKKPSLRGNIQVVSMSELH